MKQQLAQLQQRPFTASQVAPAAGRSRKVSRISCRAQQQQQSSSMATDAASASLLQRAGAAALSGLLTASILCAGPAAARPAGVNRPDLLPREANVPVIDVAGFLTPSEEKRLVSEVTSLERDTGVKVRVLAQNFPDTPGLAIREYWGVDDSSVVLVADPTFGDILNFNVGQGVDLAVPRSFWGRLSGKYGNKFYWQAEGESAAIMNAVSAIDTCLREPDGRTKCSTVQAAPEELK